MGSRVQLEQSESKRVIQGFEFFTQKSKIYEKYKDLVNLSEFSD